MRLLRIYLWSLASFLFIVTLHCFFSVSSMSLYCSQSSINFFSDCISSLFYLSDILINLYLPNSKLVLGKVFNTPCGLFESQVHWSSFQLIVFTYFLLCFVPYLSCGICHLLLWYRGFVSLFGILCCIIE